MADDDDNKAGPLTTRQQGNHLTRPTTWVDRELEDTIARKARAGRQLTEVEVELERAKLEFYREMIESSSGKKDELETAQLIEDIRKKEGRPIKPIEVPQIYWESDKAKNEYLERYYKSLNKIYREHDFQEMERQRQFRIEERRKEREKRLLTQGSTQNLPVPAGQTQLPHRPIGDPHEEGLPPVHHYHTDPLIPRLPDPQAYGRTYRPDPAPIGYLRNNLLEPHEKEAIEKEYWDVIEGRNDDWLYRNKFEKVLVKIIPERFIVDDVELKSNIRFQRYLYDRLAVKHAKRLTGITPYWKPWLRFWKWVLTPLSMVWWVNYSPYIRDMEERHVFDDLTPWMMKFGSWQNVDNRSYMPPNTRFPFK